MNHDMSMNHAVSDEALETVAGGKKKSTPKPKYKVGDFVRFYDTHFSCEVTGTIQERSLEQGSYYEQFYVYKILIDCVPPDHHIFSGKSFLETGVYESSIKGLC